MKAKMAYAWKPNSRHSIPAQTAGEEISRIRKERGSFFTPEDVVTESEPEDAVLHPEFEWDDKRAAVEYRKEQARHLVDHVVVIEESTPKEEWIRAFVSVRTNEGPRFTSTEYAFSIPSLREDVLSQVLNDFRVFERKYRQYLDLAQTYAELRKSVAAAERRLKVKKTPPVVRRNPTPPPTAYIAKRSAKTSETRATSA